MAKEWARLEAEPEEVVEASKAKPVPYISLDPQMAREREEYALFTALLGSSVEAKRLRQELEDAHFHQPLRPLFRFLQEFEKKHGIPPSFASLHRFVREDQ